LESLIRWVTNPNELYYPIAADDEPREKTIFVLLLPKRRTTARDDSKSEGHTFDRERGQVETSLHHLFCPAGQAKNSVGMGLQCITSVEDACQRWRFST
jgi:hypothetical protein